VISFATGDIGISLYIEFGQNIFQKKSDILLFHNLLTLSEYSSLFKTQVHNINRVNKKMGKKFAFLKEHL